MTTSKKKKTFLKDVLKAEEVICYEEIKEMDADTKKFGGNMIKALKKACPKGVDVYFDNVGGSLLDMVLTVTSNNFRVALCGAISGYNGDIEPLKNYHRMIFKRGTIQGFIFLDHFKHFGKARKQITSWLKEGKIHVEEDVLYNLSSAPLGL